jgi:hypothetical protein
MTKQSLYTVIDFLKMPNDIFKNDFDLERLRNNNFCDKKIFVT